MTYQSRNKNSSGYIVTENDKSKNIHKSFDAWSAQGVDIEIAKGEIVSIVGPWCRKNNLIANAWYAGSAWCRIDVEVNDVNFSKLNEKELAAFPLSTLVLFSVSSIASWVHNARKRDDTGSDSIVRIRKVLLLVPKNLLVTWAFPSVWSINHLNFRGAKNKEWP